MFNKQWNESICARPDFEIQVPFDLWLLNKRIASIVLSLTDVMNALIKQMIRFHASVNKATKVSQAPSLCAPIGKCDLIHLQVVVNNSERIVFSPLFVRTNYYLILSIFRNVRFSDWTRGKHRMIVRQY